MFEQAIATVDSVEQELTSFEAAKSELEVGQVEILRQLDSAQVAIGDGCRTMTEWVASRLDLSQQVARDLMELVKANQPDLDALLKSGEIGFERAVMMTRLRQAGAFPELVSRSDGYDLGGLQKSSPTSAPSTAPTKRLPSSPAISYCNRASIVPGSSSGEPKSASTLK